MLLPRDHEERLQVYHESATDAEAAASIGLSLAGFRLWRRSRNLPPAGSGLRAALSKQRRILWEFGWNDVEIAQFEECSATTIRNWRNRNNLATNIRAYPEFDPEEAFEALDNTTCDREAGEVLGITKKQFREWRLKMGVPSEMRREQYHCPTMRERNQRRWDAYCREVNATAAAKRAGIPQSAMSRWIRREGLPQYNDYANVKRAILTKAREGDLVARRASIMHGWIPV